MALSSVTLPEVLSTPVVAWTSAPFSKVMSLMRVPPGKGVLVGVRVGVVVGVLRRSCRVTCWSAWACWSACGSASRSALVAVAANGRTGRRGRAGRRVGRRLRSAERIDVMQIAAGVLVAGQHHQAGRAVHVLLGRGRVVELGVECVFDEQLAVPAGKRDGVHVRHFAIDIAAALGRGAEDVDLAVAGVEQHDRAGVVLAAPVDDGGRQLPAEPQPSVQESSTTSGWSSCCWRSCHRRDADAVALELDVDMVVGG